MHGIEIQVVGRLIKKQRRRIAEKRLRQQHAHFLAALQISHGAFVQRIRHVQAVEQDAGIGLRRVTILVADNRFELGQTHAVVIRQLVVGLLHTAHRAPAALSTNSRCP